MRSFYPWPFFPTNLAPENARSLSLQFVLQEILFFFERVEQNPKRLEQILVFSLENPFIEKGGCLDKLCFYCKILIQTYATPLAETIPEILEDMRTQVMKTHHKLHFLPAQNVLLTDLYTLLKGNLIQLFYALAPFLEKQNRDEKVLFSLVEHRKQWNHFLGPKAIEKLLLELFPEGLEALCSFLRDAFDERGFNDFIAAKEPLLEDLVCLSSP